MRRYRGLFTLGLALSFWAMAITNFSLPASAAYLAAKVKLQAGTPVVLRLAQSLSSETARVGDPVNFEVARNVEVNGKVVIRQGARATGSVASVQKKGMLGSPGKIMLAVQSVPAADDTSVPLRGSVSQEGQSNLVLSIVLGLLCILGFFVIQGGSADVPAGSEVKAYTDVDMEINV